MKALQTATSNDAVPVSLPWKKCDGKFVHPFLKIPDFPIKLQQLSSIVFQEMFLVF